MDFELADILPSTLATNRSSSEFEQQQHTVGHLTDLEKTPRVVMNERRVSSSTFRSLPSNRSTTPAASELSVPGGASVVEESSARAKTGCARHAEVESTTHEDPFSDDNFVIGSDDDDDEDGADFKNAHVMHGSGDMTGSLTPRRGHFFAEDGER